MNNKPLKIVRLESSNIKRLKAVEIVPNSNSVVISGANDQGKTSVLDSIEYALGGKDAICERPIRDGASKAHVICDLQDLVVTRRFTAAGGSTLTVTAKDGTPLKSPQAVLDSLCSHVAFDPLSFVRMKAQEQLETLRKLVGLDFSSLDSEKKRAYEERTSVNRELSAAKSKLAIYPIDPSAPKEEVKVSDLMTQLEDLREHNKANEKVKQSWNEASAELVAAKNTIEAMRAEAAELEARLLGKRRAIENATSVMAVLEGKLKDSETSVAQLVYKDEQPIKDQISAADDLNAKVRGNRRHLELKGQVDQLDSKVDALTQRIEAIDTEKQEALKNAKFPLENLSFDESGVLLNGVPFSQGSQARQLQAAVAIGLALNPRVRVILIRDASLLDDASMELLKGLAEKHDAQIWFERVSDNNPGCIIIEDGAIKE